MLRLMNWMRGGVRMMGGREMGRKSGERGRRGKYDQDPMYPTTSRSAKVSELHRRLAEYERNEEEKKLNGFVESQWTVESEAAERFLRWNIVVTLIIFRANPSKFSSIWERRKEEEAKRNEIKEKKEENEKKQEEAFPFKADEGIERREEEESLPPSSSSIPLSDQGFFISGNLYVDEYSAATITDLPEDEMTVASREVFGADDAVETIDFQLPGQDLKRLKVHSSGGGMEDEISLGEDEGMEVRSERKCAGCGANYHCMDDALPGYLPPTLLAREEKKAERGVIEASLCKRCHLIKNHHFLPNVNVCPVDYATMLSKLKGRQEVLILLVVDILDLPGSIHRALPQIIGKGKPMIVIANKVDLLPSDAKVGYLRRFKETVEREIAAAGFLDSFNILHTALVSAKTGYGIEDLITEIHMKWTNVRSSMRDDIFLVGCTNAGKSSIFNTLLQSDLCKVRAVDLVERATTSVWPGTTLSLLKFPVMRPSAFKLELRKRRLISHRAWVQKEAYARKKTLQRTGNAEMAVLVEPVMNTYKDREEGLQPVAVASLLDATRDEGEERRGRPWSLSDPVFTKGVWCYDTPGTVNEEQILDILSLRELVNVVPNRLLRPRTLILSAGKSLLIGGLARLDLLEMKKERPVWVTVFANEALPLNVMETERTEEFMEKMRGRAVMGAPIGDSSRLASLPPMDGRMIKVKQSEEMRRERKEKDESLVGLADIVFSSIGWAMVSTHAREVYFSASLPGGRGLSVRDPPILPYSALLRGPRIPGSDFYKVNPPKFPINFKRLEADRNRRKFNISRKEKNRDQ
ncbi:hypothetical protein PMAYCL1PPCAC_07280 [Pristionchus mayeri]|uniref:G domain-containing protein n=1 Tax=Pristionchus mayeri TaxID=1317129 RepID=A0AAN5CAS4_9BILA|nr:hypothetical protein PMAYCL1PPCAC_07280 [Pristionchus mayeri]